MPTVKFVANPGKGDGMPESVKETVRTHLDHGRACLDAGKYDDAIADYDKAIALAPNVATAYTNLHPWASSGSRLALPEGKALQSSPVLRQPGLRRQARREAQPR